jgi:hypothetical protein
MATPARQRRTIGARALAQLHQHAHHCLHEGGLRAGEVVMLSESSRRKNTDTCGFESSPGRRGVVGREREPRQP